MANKKTERKRYCYHLAFSQSDQPLNKIIIPFFIKFCNIYDPGNRSQVFPLNDKAARAIDIMAATRKNQQPPAFPQSSAGCWNIACFFQKKHYLPGSKQISAFCVMFILPVKEWTFTGYAKRNCISNFNFLFQKTNTNGCFTATEHYPIVSMV